MMRIAAAARVGCAAADNLNHYGATDNRFLVPGGREPRNDSPVGVLGVLRCPAVEASLGELREPRRGFPLSQRRVYPLTLLWTRTVPRGAPSE